MKKNKNKISIFKRIGLVALAFVVAIGSFFVGVQKNGHNQSLIASADYTSGNDIVFNSSDIIYSRLGNSDQREDSFVDLQANTSLNPDLSANLEFVNWTFRVSFNDSYTGSIPGLVLSLKGQNYHNSSGTLSCGTFNTITQTTPQFIDAFISSSWSSLGSGDFSFNSNYSLTPCFAGSSGDKRFSLLGAGVIRPVGSSAPPSLVMTSIQLGSYVDDFTLFTGDTIVEHSLPTELYYSNIICYTDSNDWKYLFFIPTWYNYSVQPESYLTYRKYYTDAFEFFDNNQIYNEGYANGLADNQSNIYDKGYKAGKTAGEAIGYDKGVLEANDYSFMSLFGAVIDVPIKAFSGLFNFEILGINLFDFFLGLLTFGVVIFVIKLLLGGR